MVNYKRHHVKTNEIMLIHCVLSGIYRNKIRDTIGKIIVNKLIFLIISNIYYNKDDQYECVYELYGVWTHTIKLY